jgi:hypothetical protein
VSSGGSSSSSEKPPPPTKPKKSKIKGIVSLPLTIHYTLCF